MEIVKSDDYEPVAAEFQFRLVEVLDDVLKRHKVPFQVRKDVCGDYAFHSGVLLDQGHLNVSGVEYEPMAAFLREGKLYVRSDFFEFHDYAFGNTEEYFSSKPG